MYDLSNGSVSSDVDDPWPRFQGHDVIFRPTTTTSSQHAQPSGVLRRRSDGLECAAWRPPRPVAQCWQFPEDAKDASVSECTLTLSALEALRNALYKFKTYLLTMDALNVLCVQLKRDVFTIAKFLWKVCWCCSPKIIKIFLCLLKLQLAKVSTFFETQFYVYP